MHNGNSRDDKKTGRDMVSFLHMTTVIKVVPKNENANINSDKRKQRSL